MGYHSIDVKYSLATRDSRVDEICLNFADAYITFHYFVN